MTLPVTFPFAFPAVLNVEDFVDIEDAVAFYLNTLGIVPPGQLRAGDMPSGAAWPFVVITRITGGDDRVTDYPSIDADIFHPDYTTASTIGRHVHRGIKSLKPRGLMFRPTINVPTDSGETVPFVIDRLEVVEAPVLRDYEDSSVKRLVGRYRIEHRCTAAA
jgi:hypothetical protein